MRKIPVAFFHAGVEFMWRRQQNDCEHHRRMHIGRELSLAGRVFESTHNFTLLEMAYDGQLVQSRSGIFSIVPLRWASELPDILIKSNISHCRDEREANAMWVLLGLSSISGSINDTRQMANWFSRSSKSGVMEENTMNGVVERLLESRKCLLLFQCKRMQLENLLKIFFN